MILHPDSAPLVSFLNVNNWGNNQSPHGGTPPTHTSDNDSAEHGVTEVEIVGPFNFYLKNAFDIISYPDIPWPLITDDR